MKTIAITLAAAAVLAACTVKETTERSTAAVVPPPAVVASPPVIVSPPPAVVSPPVTQTVTVNYTGPNGFDLAQQKADAYCGDRFANSSARLMNDDRVAGRAMFECVVSG